jgi:hypothetical protein
MLHYRIIAVEFTFDISKASLHEKVADHKTTYKFFSDDQPCHFAAENDVSETDLFIMRE